MLLFKHKQPWSRHFGLIHHLTIDQEFNDNGSLKPAFSEMYFIFLDIYIN